MYTDDVLFRARDKLCGDASTEARMDRQSAHSTIFLSRGCRCVTKRAPGSFASVRSRTAVPRGRILYIEFKVSDAVSRRAVLAPALPPASAGASAAQPDPRTTQTRAMVFGLAPASMHSASMVGSAPLSLGYASSGHYVMAGQWQACARGFGPGNIIGLLCSLDSSGLCRVAFSVDDNALCSRRHDALQPELQQHFVDTIEFVVPQGEELFPTVSLLDAGAEAFVHLAAIDLKYDPRATFRLPPQVPLYSLDGVQL